ncbi:MAG: chaperone modulator CbpM [Caldimonas sp.]
MSRAISTALCGTVVEENVELTLVELGRACEASEEQIEHWVLEGVLEPIGRSRAEWRFAGSSLTRVRLASRLSRDLELNASGVALAIDLLERIASLESRLGR